MFGSAIGFKLCAIGLTNLSGWASVFGLVSGVFGIPVGLGSSFDYIRTAPVESPEQTIVISFDEVSGLIPGSPVVVNGQIAGKIERIAPLADASSEEIKTVCSKNGNCVQKAEPNYTVGIKLSGGHAADLRSGTIGIITSPSGRDELSAVELLVPENSAPINFEAPIAGFSSFEKFWNSDGLI